jgi:hypothetical protein
MLIHIVLAEGIDPWNQSRSTIVDVKLHEDTPLSHVHNRIITGLSINTKDDFWYYKGDEKREWLDTSLTIHELGLKDHDVIVLEGRKNRKRQEEDEMGTKGHGNTIELVCYSRIGVRSHATLRKIKVFVRPRAYCRDLMLEIGSHIGKNDGLKFKCGRVVLKEEKTFEEQGVVDGDEIVVTGGRG